MQLGTFSQCLEPKYCKQKVKRGQMTARSGRLTTQWKLEVGLIGDNSNAIKIGYPSQQ